MNYRIDILKTPEIKVYEYGPFKTDDKVLQEMIDAFAITLETNVLEENLILFHNNISTLTVTDKGIFLKKILGLFKDSTDVGLYYFKDNMISVLPLRGKNVLSRCMGVDTEEYIMNLYHELLHMASTIIDGNMIFSGFCQIGEINIGVAIDEAYTEILLHRYFGSNDEYLSYDYEVAIITLIEAIVGQNKMTSLYFNANLYDLVQELEKYNTKENILMFLDNLDSVYVLRDYTKKYRKDIIYYHNEIAKFLVDTYLNKLKFGSDKNPGYDYKLDRFLNSVHIAFKKLGVDKVRVKK